MVCRQDEDIGPDRMSGDAGVRGGKLVTPDHTAFQVRRYG